MLEVGKSFDSVCRKVAQRLAYVLQAFYGTEPLANGRGGSIPFISEFTAKFAGCDILVTGPVTADSFMHGMLHVLSPTCALVLPASGLYF